MCSPFQKIVSDPLDMGMAPVWASFLSWSSESSMAIHCMISTRTLKNPHGPAVYRSTTGEERAMDGPLQFLHFATPTARCFALLPSQDSFRFLASSSFLASGQPKASSLSNLPCPNRRWTGCWTGLTGLCTRAKGTI